MARKRLGLNFPGMVAKGENPNGMIAQTPNGTASDDTGAGQQDSKYGMQADGPRWNGGDDYSYGGIYGPVGDVARKGRRGKRGY